MTSSQVYHHAKFRWTENLTCRFIQLRKEHGKMFTGRKYSAQAGWEYILRQMREEFPTTMADVHYRVLKKKWSNLLQQYKELKNPVHGDKNKADDISWPFYSAIDEVLGSNSNHSFTLPGRSVRRHTNDTNVVDNDDEDDMDDDLNPQEFLCVSVSPDDDDEEITQQQPDITGNGASNAVPGLPRLQPLRRGPVFDVERIPRATRRSTTTTTTTTTAVAAASSRKRSAPTDEGSLLSRLPPATELTIRSVRRSVPDLQPPPPPSLLESMVTSANGGLLSRDLEISREAKEAKEEEERPRKYARRNETASEERESRLERRIVEFLEYTKRRDEENRGILMRMLEAIEDIRNAVG